MTTFLPGNSPAGPLPFILTVSFHDDIIKWKHFPHYWPFMPRIHGSLVNSPHKGQWCEALVFSLICAWTNGWVNNRDASDLRCHHTHYDVTVMFTTSPYNTILGRVTDPICITLPFFFQSFNFWMSCLYLQKPKSGQIMHTEEVQWVKVAVSSIKLGQSCYGKIQSSGEHKNCLSMDILTQWSALWKCASSHQISGGYLKYLNGSLRM